MTSSAGTPETGNHLRRNPRLGALRHLIAVAAAAAILLLSGCGSTAETTVTAPVVAPETAAAPAAAPETAAAPAAAPETAANAVPAAAPETAAGADSDDRAQLEPDCVDLYTAMNLAPGTPQAAARFIEATSPGPGGLTEALWALSDMYLDVEPSIDYPEAITRLFGYYDFLCEFQTDFGLESEGNAPEVRSEFCTDDQYPMGGDLVVANIPANDPDGGLVGHVNPGVYEPIVRVLPEGTRVLAGFGPSQCWISIEGAIWWLVTPYDLGDSMWVNTKYVEVTSALDAAPVPDTAPVDTSEAIDFDTAQWQCYTLGFEPACDILVQYGYDDHLGNMFMGAPEDIVKADCAAGQLYSCAHLGRLGIVLDEAHQRFLNGIVGELTTNCNSGYQGACNLLATYR